MTINLPDDLERFLRAEVHRGHFASPDAAVAEAVRLLRRQLTQAAAATPTPAAPATASASALARIGPERIAADKERGPKIIEGQGLMAKNSPDAEARKAAEAALEVLTKGR